MSEPPIIKDPPKEDKPPTSLTAAVAEVLKMGKMMITIMYNGDYKKLRKEKDFEKYPQVSVDQPKDLHLEKKFGKGKQLDGYIRVFMDMLFMIFDALNVLPDAGAISAYEVVNYKKFLPGLLKTGDDYELGLRVKNKKEIIEWDQLRAKSAKEMAALIPTVPEIVLVISKK